MVNNYKIETTVPTKISSSRGKLKNKSKNRSKLTKNDSVMLKEAGRCHGTFGMSGVDSAAFMPSL